MLTHSNMIANVLQGAVLDPPPWWTCQFAALIAISIGIDVLILAPIFRGISVHIMQRFDLEQFCQVLQRVKITAAYAVPHVTLLLAKRPLVSTCDLSSLRMIHSSAAPLTQDLVDMVYNRLNVPIKSIKQGYGLSEASASVASQVSTWLFLYQLSSLT